MATDGKASYRFTPNGVSSIAFVDMLHELGKKVCLICDGTGHSENDCPSEKEIFKAIAGAKGQIAHWKRVKKHFRDQLPA